MCEPTSMKSVRYPRSSCRIYPLALTPFSEMVLYLDVNRSFQFDRISMHDISFSLFLLFCTIRRDHHLHNFHKFEVTEILCRPFSLTLYTFGFTQLAFFVPSLLILDHYQLHGRQQAVAIVMFCFRYLSVHNKRSRFNAARTTCS